MKEETDQGRKNVEKEKGLYYMSQLQIIWQGC